MRIVKQILSEVRRLIIVAPLAALALAPLAASAQQEQDPPMYGANLLLTNQVFTNGVVTLGPSNYPANGGWINFPSAGGSGSMRATNLVLSLLSAPAQFVTNTNGLNVYTNSFNSTNNVPLIITWQIVQDDFTSAYKLSSAFGVTQTTPVPATWTNVTVTNVLNIGSNSVWQLVGTNAPFTNFYGCKKGRILQLQYLGTNSLCIYFLRGGFIMGGP